MHVFSRLQSWTVICSADVIPQVATNLEQKKYMLGAEE
jgi:hypothetical protein